MLGPVQVQRRLLGPHRGRTGSFFWKICSAGSSVGLFVPSVFRLLLIIRCFVSITSSHHRMHMPWPKVKAIVVPGIPLALPLPLPLPLPLLACAFTFTPTSFLAALFSSLFLLLLWLLFALGGVRKIFFLVGSACYCSCSSCCYCVVDGVMM